MMTIRSKLILGFVAAILIGNGLLAFFTVRHVKQVLVEEVQTRVRLDLNAARSVYNGRLEDINRLLHTAAVLWTEVGQSAQLPEEKDNSSLLRLYREGQIDMLSLVSADGRVIFRAHNPQHRGDSLLEHPVVDRVLKTSQAVSGTVILSPELLEPEGNELVERARTEILATPAAHAGTKTVETSGMVIMAGVPILTHEGRCLGLLLGGNLLNKRYRIVDSIKELVFQNQTYRGKEIGTATIFQGDLRISTNVKLEDGSRAIGTRMSEEVYQHVLLAGEVWSKRAFVVNDWYLTAYEPIRDLDGTILGALYVGVLEEPFLRPQYVIVELFLIVLTIATAATLAVANFETKLILRPTEKIVEMSRKVIAGDLTARVNIRPPGEFGLLCRAIDRMAEAVAQREEQLKQATKQQIHKSEKLASVGRLAAGIAHEINNPLTGVLTFAHLLKEQDHLTDRDRQDLDVIVRETTRVREIVRGLLDYARESPSLHEMLDLNEVIRKTINLVRGQKDFKRIRIIEQLDPHLPPVYGDTNKIQQVILNLALNAGEAMPNGGELRLETCMQDQNLIFRITDNGCGITCEDLDKIFDPFFTTKPVGKGTGLGLSVSLGIIEKHGGTLEVLSEIGQGTTFIISLPLDRKPEGASNS